MAKATKKDTPSYDHFEQFGQDMEGYEGINLETMSIPFIKLLQTLSPQLSKKKPEFIAEAEEGVLFNTISEEMYGKSLRIVVGKFERYYIEWGDKRGVFVETHDPAEFERTIMPSLIRDEKNKLVNPNNKHTFVETYIYYVVMPDHMEEGVCILSLSSSGIKEAKKLNRKLMSTMIPGTTRRALPHFMVWNADVVDMSNDSGDWFGLKFNFNAFVNKEQLELVVEERKALPNKAVDYAQLGETTSEEKSEEEVKY